MYPLQIVDPFFQLSQHRKPMDRQTNFRGVLGSIHHPKLWSVPVNIQKVLCPLNPQMLFFGKNRWGKTMEFWRHAVKVQNVWRKRKWLLKRKWRICWDSEFATSLAFWRRCLRMKQDAGANFLVALPCLTVRTKPTYQIPFLHFCWFVPAAWRTTKTS